MATEVDQTKLLMEQWRENNFVDLLPSLALEQMRRAPAGQIWIKIRPWKSVSFPICAGPALA
jgi:hypothetical protein